LRECERTWTREKIIYVAKALSQPFVSADVLSLLFNAFGTAYGTAGVVYHVPNVSEPKQKALFADHMIGRAWQLQRHLTAFSLPVLLQADRASLTIFVKVIKLKADKAIDECNSWRYLSIIIRL
jgi:hypothetical protein